MRCCARLSQKTSDAQFPEDGGDRGNRREGLFGTAHPFPQDRPSQLHAVALDQNEGSYGFWVNYSDQTFTIE